jgi:hypothetical protein
MKTEFNQIKKLNIKELLNNKEQYVIPVYQRNYAWEAKEIEQLIQDVIDYGKQYSQRNYYIGTLVVSVEKDNEMVDFSTIDGQQRLTTLSILSAVIKNNYRDIDMVWLENLNLRFASRKRSDTSIKAAYNGRFDGEDHEVSIKAAYEICEQELVKRTKESGISVKEFADYLYQYVIILRVPLPENIDLNHYFEIMNSRGEQLEKHEVLKAKLMECFNGYEQKHRSECEACFDLVWEACSNMEKYVQYGFSTDQRHLIFGDKNWNSLAVYSFDELVRRIKDTLRGEGNLHASTIDDILNEKSAPIEVEESEESPDRFNSVVNFQNFLLHVLRVQLGKDEVALDDKRLLKLFDEEMPKPGPERIAFVKKFIYNLLKCKFLFDKYVIKREFTANTDRWSLKSLKWYSLGKVKNGVKYVNTYGDENSDSFDNDNRRVLMLLSMFHVSIPSMVYKYWLNAALNYLFNQFEINSKEYISYLEHIAKAFVFDRYLAKSPKEYFDMVYINLKPVERNIEQLDLNKLRFGQIENNLVFNFMDYLLWSRYKDIEKDSRVKTFEYTFRSSVEHYYPQNPIKDDVVKLAPEYLHSFGNLCLISHEKNSRLSNFSANNKREFYGKKATIDSLKQFLMMKYPEWTFKEIEKHGAEMVNLLKENLNSTCESQ